MLVRQEEPPPPFMMYCTKSHSRGDATPATQAKGLGTRGLDSWSVYSVLDL